VQAERREMFRFRLRPALDMTDICSAASPTAVIPTEVEEAFFVSVARVRGANLVEIRELGPASISARGWVQQMQQIATLGATLHHAGGMTRPPQFWALLAASFRSSTAARP
jgi:hypothetical protein